MVTIWWILGIYIIGVILAVRSKARKVVIIEYGLGAFIVGVILTVRGGGIDGLVIVLTFVLAVYVLYTVVMSFAALVWYLICHTLHDDMSKMFYGFLTGVNLQLENKKGKQNRGK